MGFESVTDEKIKQLIVMKKKVTNPNARKLDKEGHFQYNYTVTGDPGYSFQLFVRQNKLLEDDFSCGLSWLMPSGKVLTLKRYNGPGHCHKNRMENQKLCYNTHVHMATEQYIQANRKPDGFAEVNKSFRTMKGALHCLAGECNISGLQTEPDEPSLFDE